VSNIYSGSAKAYRYKADALLIIPSASEIILNCAIIEKVATEMRCNTVRIRRRHSMASKDKAGKEERKKPKLDIKEKRKAKIEKKKAGTVISTNA